MKSRFITLPLLVIALAGCDKAKNLANEAASAVKERINSPANALDSSTVDPELQKLVHQNAEGVIFRKDLPFPSRLKVRTTLRREISGRLFQTSAIDHKAETVKGTQITIRKLERDGGRVSHTLEQASFSVPSVDKKDGVAKLITDPLKQVAPSNKPVEFHLTGKNWKTNDHSEFRTAALSQQLSPVFEDLLVENALSPRRMWFSKRRLKVGDEIVASGESLPMLLTGDATGSLKLKLESFEAVEGHPCGVFSIKGNYTRKQFPDFEGVFTDEDVTIESGKIWLSLIHPLILRQEFNTIQTFKTGGQGGLSAHGQGTVKVSLLCSWKPL
ncbi:MAG: hypothetical protein WCS43_02160 [Verrucomicrobiota bacterium]